VVSTGFALSWATALRTTNYQLYLDELAEHIAAVAIHWRDGRAVDRRGAVGDDQRYDDPDRLVDRSATAERDENRGTRTDGSGRQRR
jgi:hypothetical protein